MADAVEEGKAMRKDEELEAESAESRIGEASIDSVKKPVHAIDIEEELKDDELLGEATLAKLSPVPGIDEVKLEEVVVEETATNEDIIDDAAVKEEKEK
jgi:hypothetical protein